MSTEQTITDLAAKFREELSYREDVARRAAKVAAEFFGPVALIRTHIIRVLEAHDRREDEFLEKCDAKQKEGFRLVTGGQEGDGWVVRDWDADQVIISGTGGYDDYRAALDQHDPDGKWYDAEALREDMDWSPVETPGVPPGLAQALEEWIDQDDVATSEIAAVIGWPVQKVAEYR